MNEFVYHVKVAGWGEELCFTLDGAKEILKRQLEAAQPDQRWEGSITLYVLDSGQISYYGNTISKLQAKLDALTSQPDNDAMEALETIATQKLPEELQFVEADWEGGYRMCVETARKAVNSTKRPDTA